MIKQYPKVAPHRSDEAMYWLIFGAGGMVAAIVLPSILIIMILAGLLGTDSGLLAFEQMSYVFGNFILSGALFGIVLLLCMYAMHRIHHSTHDFGIHSKATFFIFYGGAAFIAFFTFGVQFLSYCKLW